MTQWEDALKATSREAVLAELKQYDELGEERYLNEASALVVKGGGGQLKPARSHYIAHEGFVAPLKAIARAAQFRQTGETRNTHSPDFAKAFRELGFDVFVNHDANSSVNGPLEFLEREKKFSEVVLRPNQWTFRQKILGSCRGRCVISQCDVTEALEACHIVPFHEGGADTEKNGLLLRRDLHRLFDLAKIAVNPTDMSVWVAESAKPFYQEFSGIAAQVPNCVDSKNLEHHWSRP